MNSFEGFIRRTVPRRIRNGLRRPRVTASRLLAKSRFFFGQTGNVELYPQFVIRCHPMCIPEFSVFMTDPAQQAEMEEFVAHAKSGMRLLDVGAHWGVFTLAALYFGGAEAKVLCVEPSRDAARVLRRNLQLNGKADKACVVEAAAGLEAGEVEMLTTGAGGADYFVTPSEHRPDTVSVQQIAITELCHLLGFTPTHIKMDIEGFEEEALWGARALLAESAPTLFLELHGDLIRARGRDPQQVIKLLRELEYTRMFLGGREMNIEDLAAIAYNARLRLEKVGKPCSPA